MDRLNLDRTISQNSRPCVQHTLTDGKILNDIEMNLDNLLKIEQQIGFLTILANALVSKPCYLNIP